MLPMIAFLWVAGTPFALLFLAFAAPRMKAGLRLGIGIALNLMWLPLMATAASAPDWLSDMTLLNLIIVGLCCMWVAMHKLIAGMRWRQGWIAHLAVAVLKTLLLAYVLFALAFTSGGHH